MAETISRLSGDLNRKVSLESMAPPSPQLSDDDLMHNLAVSDKNSINNKELIAPLSCELIHDSDTLKSYETEKDIASMIYNEFVNIIYWKIPGRSSIVLGGILSTLILSGYYSLLYIFAATYTIVTGVNLICVNLFIYLRSIWSGLPVEEFDHPYHIHIKNQRFKIASRDLLEYYIHKTLDVVEVIIQKAAKILLVEDSKFTALSFFVSSFIYYAARYISVKTLFGLFALGIFTIPYYYKQHQHVVDKYLTLAKKKSKIVLNKYSDIIVKQSGRFYELNTAVQTNLKQQFTTKWKKSSPIQQKVTVNSSAIPKDDIDTTN